VSFLVEAGGAGTSLDASARLTLGAGKYIFLNKSKIREEFDAVLDR
jgi:hypothetical protein